jgi:hypothetical protein
MNRALIVAAVSEAATGAGLLIVPTLIVRLLLGVELSGASIVIARMTGIALIALGTACWPGRMTPFPGMLIYNAVTTAYLVWVVVQGNWVGPLLLPVVILHVLMTILLGGSWFMAQKTADQNNYERL